MNKFKSILLKGILVSFFTFLIISSNAQSVLRLTLSGNAEYVVAFNGIQQPAINNQICFSNLSAGKFPIKIIEQLPGGFTKIVYSGFLTFEANSEIIAIYQPQSGFSIFSTTYIAPIAIVESTSSTSPITPNTESSVCMNEANFQKLLATITNEVFDDKRTKLIVSSVSSGALLTTQAIKLLALFTFDDKRLVCALELMPYICDKDNYWQAGDVFTFISNKKTFLNRIEDISKD
jgi:hypothetical protein